MTLQQILAQTPSATQTTKMPAQSWGTAANQLVNHPGIAAPTMGHPARLDGAGVARPSAALVTAATMALAKRDECSCLQCRSHLDGTHDYHDRCSEMSLSVRDTIKIGWQHIALINELLGPYVGSLRWYL